MSDLDIQVPAAFARERERKRSLRELKPQRQREQRIGFSFLCFSLPSSPSKPSNFLAFSSLALSSPLSISRRLCPVTGNRRLRRRRLRVSLAPPQTPTLTRRLLTKIISATGVSVGRVVGSMSFSQLPDNREPILSNYGDISEHKPLFKLKRWQWWVLVAINIFFLVFGQCAAVLLGRFYYDQGGNSKWLATLVQTAAFPICFVPLIMFPKSKESSTTSPPSAPLLTITLIYFFLGVLIAGDNMLYSTGLLYLSASTYSLICATQLAFNAIFSYFINSQKFTVLILNSVVLLSFSASLIAVNDDSGGPSGVSRGKYIIGFMCTIGASAIYSLLLSLMQLTFEKVIKKETFSVVLNMQIYTSLFATCVSLVALFASGEWKTLHGEMESFGKGRVSYALTLAGTAIAWQVCSVGVVGLIFLVSSLFSNVISTVALAASPVAAVMIFRDKMNGVMVIAMLLAIWGFVSYIYQNYLDDSKARKRTQAGTGTGNATRNDTAC